MHGEELWVLTQETPAEIIAKQSDAIQALLNDPGTPGDAIEAL